MIRVDRSVRDEIQKRHHHRDHPGPSRLQHKRHPTIKTFDAASNVIRVYVSGAVTGSGDPVKCAVLDALRKGNVWLVTSSWH